MKECITTSFPKRVIAVDWERKTDGVEKDVEKKEEIEKGVKKNAKKERS